MYVSLKSFDYNDQSVFSVEDTFIVFVMNLMLGKLDVMKQKYGYGLVIQVLFSLKIFCKIASKIVRKLYRIFSWIKSYLKFG